MAEDSIDISGGQEQLILFPDTNLDRVRFVFSARKQNITFYGDWYIIGIYA